MFHLHTHKVEVKLLEPKMSVIFFYYYFILLLLLSLPFYPYRIFYSMHCKKKTTFTKIYCSDKVINPLDLRHMPVAFPWGIHQSKSMVSLRNPSGEIRGLPLRKFVASLLPMNPSEEVRGLRLKISSLRGRENPSGDVT